MIALLRRWLPAPRPTAAEVTLAWTHTQLTPRRLQLLDDIAAGYPGPQGAPELDPEGTNRWASPGDAYPWVKTGPDRWVHVGGYAVRSDRQVASFLPGTQRTHRPPRRPWPR